MAGAITSTGVGVGGTGVGVGGTGVGVGGTGVDVGGTGVAVGAAAGAHATRSNATIRQIDKAVLWILIAGSSLRMMDRMEM
jgi:hypothetical protein